MVPVGARYEKLFFIMKKAFLKFRNFLRRPTGSDIRPDIFLMALSVTVVFFISMAYFAINEVYISKFTDPVEWGNLAMCLALPISLASFYVLYFSYFQQMKISRNQQFDSTYFNMLKVQREIYEKINHTTFVDLAQDIDNTLQIDFTKRIENSDIEFFKTAYGYALKLIGRSNGDIMHYFRHMYHIITFVDDSDVDWGMKKKYISLIQAQMSNEELLVMCFNVIHYCYNETTKNEKYIKLLDDYHFFKNLRCDVDNCLKQRLRSIFKDTTFKHL